MKILLSLLLAFLFIDSAYSQPWNYNFGTSTGTYNTTNSSETFLPTPPSGIARVRRGNQGGSFNLQTTAFFGFQSVLRIVAPTGGSVNKFSVYNYSAGKSFTLKFSMRLGASDGSSNGATSGIWTLFIGDGAMYSDNNNFAGAQVFTGLRLTFSSDSILTTVRNGSNWVTTGITGTPFSQGTNYVVDIYGNNTTGTLNYDYFGPRSVAAGTWDLWVEGVLCGDDLGKAELPGNVNIDSWMFYGESSAGNVANIFLDDFYYQNDIASFPLPVELGSFMASASGRSAMLNWNTLSEINNAGFEVQRSMKKNAVEDFSAWEKAGYVTGNGTVNFPVDYNFEDKNLSKGIYKYRIKQIDFNGNFEYFYPQFGSELSIIPPVSFELKQNYPNPSNPRSKIDFSMPFDGNISVKVYDVSGKEVASLADGYKTADYYTLDFDGSNLASGIYFYRVIAEGEDQKFIKTLKMVLVK
jgi:hypothetical protein